MTDLKKVMDSVQKLSTRFDAVTTRKDAKKPTRGQVQAAQDWLKSIYELATEEGNLSVAVLKHQANSASNYLKVLREADVAFPDWIERNRPFLKAACNWFFPY